MERFLARVRKIEDGCWIWEGRVRIHGYGEFDVRGPRRAQYISRKAHRVSYEMFVGPIPEGLELHHTCEVRRCVNPEHLRPILRRDHVRIGGSARLAIAKRSRTHCRNGHLYGQNPKIHKGGRVCETCSREANRRSYEKKRAELSLR